MALKFVDAPARGGYHDYSGLPQADFHNIAIAQAPPSTRFVYGGNDQPNMNPNAQFAQQPGQANFAFGTLDQMNTLEALRLYQGTVLEYGLDRLQEQIQILLEAANTLVYEQLSMLAIITPERFIRNGETASMVMQDLDPNGIPGAQKVFPTGSNQGFRLKRKGIGLGWNYEYFRQKDLKQFAAEMQALLTADANAIGLELRRAFFKATNETFYDVINDYAQLPVKALVNGDGVAIPPNPYGTTFNNGAHTHYMYCGSGNNDTVTDAGNAVWSGSTAAQKGQNLAALLQNLKEHYTTGKPVLLVDQTNAQYFLVPNGSANQIPSFVKLDYSYIIPSIQRDVVSTGRIDTQDVFNRLLGWYDGAEVWVKPWIPTNYLLGFFTDQPKPLAVRVPKGPMPGMTGSGGFSLGNGDLRTVLTMSTYPMYATAMVRDFGVSAWERQNGVAFSTNSTASYVTPSGL